MSKVPRLVLKVPCVAYLAGSLEYNLDFKTSTSDHLFGIQITLLDHSFLTVGSLLSTNCDWENFYYEFKGFWISLIATVELSINFEDL